jgi:3-hydroxybutyryl-CoA dehydrogenase
MDIHNVAVIGAGIMGRGIAYAAVVGGFRTFLNDVSNNILLQASEGIRNDLSKGAAAGKVTAAEMTSALERLILEANLETAARQADLIVEAIPEDIGLKIQLFGRLDKMSPKHAVFASNTSALSITEMAGATTRPSNVI